MSGIYTIFPAGFNDGLQVHCDMDTDGGGWIVIQRQQNDSVNFFLNWIDYQVGFGNLSGEFWLGNNNLRNLTESTGTWQLRIDLEDGEGNKVWADYAMFQITGENFQLHVDSYNNASTAGDALTNNTGMMFTTKDKDNDQDDVNNCADAYSGAWWWGTCVTQARLNCQAGNRRWTTWANKVGYIQKCSMKIRPL